jgi:hypothetical protein
VKSIALGPFGHLDFSSLVSFWLLKVRQAFAGMKFTWFEICVSTLGSNPRPWRFNCPLNNSLQTLATTMRTRITGYERQLLGTS